MRIPGFHYRGPCTYWITICTKGRRPLLGDLSADGVRLTECGRIVRDEWLRTVKLRPEINLDSFIVMPDHFHGVIQVKENPPSWAERVTGFRRGSRTLGSIVAGFKASSTSRIRRLMGDTSLEIWQRNYHERVVRDEARLQRLRRYVAENPARAWARRAGHA